MLHKRGLFTHNIIIKCIINLYTICTRIKSTQWKLLAGLKIALSLLSCVYPTAIVWFFSSPPKWLMPEQRLMDVRLPLPYELTERADRQCHLKVLLSLINNKCQFSWNLQIITRITKLLAKHFLNCFNQKFLPLHKCCVKIKKSWCKKVEKKERIKNKNSS